MLSFSVTLTFSWEGIVGRETLHVMAPRALNAEFVAFGVLERTLIAAGVPTFECGCCIDSDDVHMLAVEVTPC